MRAIWFAFLLMLAACGFKPLYGHHSDGDKAPPELANIQVNFIKDAVGQELRNAIMDRLPPPKAQPRYQLNITVDEGQTGIAIASDATVTRQQLRDTAHIVLFDSVTQKNVWKQDLFTTAGYNILSSEFSNLVGEEDARMRNVDDLSERTVNMLALFFARGGANSLNGTDLNSLNPPPPPSP